MVPAVTVMNDVSCCLRSEGRVDEFICLLNTVLANPPTETLLSVGFEEKTNFLSRYTLASCSRAELFLWIQSASPSYNGRLRGSDVELLPRF